MELTPTLVGGKVVLNRGLLQGREGQGSDTSSNNIESRKGDGMGWMDGMDGLMD